MASTVYHLEHNPQLLTPLLRLQVLLQLFLILFIRKCHPYLLHLLLLLLPLLLRPLPLLSQPRSART